MKQMDKHEGGESLLAVLQKTIDATCFSTNLYQLLFDKMNDEKRKRQLRLFLEHGQKQYQWFQYLHFLMNGAYYEHKPCQIVHDSTNDLIDAALFNEMKKTNWYYELFTSLTGTKKQVIMQALKHSLQCAATLLEMVEEINLEQIRSTRETHE
jgi:rubrerythrin